MAAIASYISVEQKRFICRLMFAFIFLCLIYLAISNTLVHQLQSPVIKYPYVDPAYWLMHLLHIPEFITSNYLVAYCFDILLFTSCIVCLIYPLNKWLIGLFLLVYFIYFVTINSYGAHHTHSGIGILLAPVPFLFSGNMAFSLMWQGLRYYTLFIYASSFLWKAFRLTWLHSDQGILILKKNLAPYLFYHPDTFLAQCYNWLLKNPSLVNLSFIVGMILEGLFIVGFFTKKFDKYLLITSIILVAGFWFMADAFFFPLLILSITFVNFSKRERKSI